jgi:hypothetical protein
MTPRNSGNPSLTQIYYFIKEILIMKNTKRIISMVMVVVLMLALSMSAFATDTVNLYVNGVYQGACNINYTYNHKGVNIVANTVYDILYIKYGSAAVWSSESDAVAAYSPLYLSGTLNGKYNKKVTYLSTLNGVGPEHYVPVAGALDAYGYYIPTQTVDTKLMEADEALEEYGGLAYWYGNGYGFAADYQHMVYIGYDWVFTVNNGTPGTTITPADPNYGSFFQYTMRESLLQSGNRIDLNYQSFFVVF